MTLTTRIRTPWVDPLELHQWVNEHLLPLRSGEHIHFEVEHGLVRNIPGQKLSALFQLKHNGGQALPAEEDDTGPVAAIEMMFDSPYSLILEGTVAEVTGSETVNLSCGMLHATFIHHLWHGFFKPRGMEFAWNADYFEEWYNTEPTVGDYGFPGFDKLRTQDEEALKWYWTQARPMIIAEAEKSGGQAVFPTDMGFESMVVKRNATEPDGDDG